MTTFSVLICTYNRPALLDMALAALILRTIEKPEQIVIVNGGDERSDKIVKHYKSKTDIRIKLVKTSNKNLAASRNIGLAHCDCEIVAMTDDDAEVFPDWVTKMKLVHEENSMAGCVGGMVIGADSNNNLLSRIADITTFSSPSKKGLVRNLPGVNVSYKRSVLEIIGPQDEVLFRGEDVDFNWRVKKSGFDVFYDPSIKVLHHHRPTISGMVSQFFYYGRAYYLVRKKWADLYCLYPHKITSLRELIKLLNFIFNIIYIPILLAVKLADFWDKIIAIPIIFFTEIAWKIGIIYQKIIEFLKIQQHEQ